MKNMWILQRSIGKGSNGYAVIIAMAISLCFGSSQLYAAPVYFNSPNYSGSSAMALNWLAYLNSEGITTPAYIVDFETGFSNGQNIDGHAFDGGFVINTTGAGNDATIVHGVGSVGGSNPVDQYAVIYYDGKGTMELNFTNPINYLSFYDIDHPVGPELTITYADSSKDTLTLDNSYQLFSRNTAEFFGLYSDKLITHLSFSLLSEAPLGDGKLGIDNIQYGAAPAVPVPAAFWLLATGLLGIIGIRRKILG
jgi:hypothetical protein